MVNVLERLNARLEYENRALKAENIKFLDEKSLKIDVKFSANLKLLIKVHVVLLICLVLARILGGETVANNMDEFMLK
ncbi:hypothetical protein ACS0TY_005021 [Phlomoides rotata]